MSPAPMSFDHDHCSLFIVLESCVGMIVTVISVILPVTQPHPCTICIPVSCDREMTGQVDRGHQRHC